MPCPMAYASSLVEVEDFCSRLLFEFGLAENTMLAYQSDLVIFARWLSLRKMRVSEANYASLLAYLAEYSRDHSITSQRRLLATLRRFYRHLVDLGTVIKDPSAALDLPIFTDYRPATFLSEEQVVRILEIPDTSSILGIRNRCILEVLYGSGMRIDELLQLTTCTEKIGQGAFRIMGKGRKERIVLLGEIALEWLDRYRLEVRPKLVKSSVINLFLSKSGRPLCRNSVGTMVRKCAHQAGVKARVSPHSFRHAYATHLLDNGADIRTVQLLLGHADISSTEIYTHICRKRLKKLHHDHHPRSRSLSSDSSYLQV